MRPPVPHFTPKEPHPCRIEYLGDDGWGFAIYDPATETYTDAVLRTGDYAGNPTVAFDTAAITHLTEYQQ
jgi:hypothetical protein